MIKLTPAGNKILLFFYLTLDSSTLYEQTLNKKNEGVLR